jgi:hypothetical protein
MAMLFDRGRGSVLGGTLDAIVLLCRAHRWPEPETEQRFHPTRKWRADYLWRDARVILEVDGGIYRGGKGGGTELGGHSSVGGILRDIDKANAAQLCGFLYLRTTPAHVRRGDVVGLLRQALGARMLFADDYTLDLTDDEWAAFSRPVTGDGGAQGLLRQLHDAQTGPQRIVVDYRLLDRAYTYAYRYASGGFQDRFRAVIKAALRSGWIVVADEGVSRPSSGAFGRRKGR